MSVAASSASAMTARSTERAVPSCSTAAASRSKKGWGVIAVNAQCN
ncbi:MAG: hypothetical protein ACRDTJ_31815 [Pseudonocardiaceae bacterium]